MAKASTFFIRATQNILNTNVYQEKEIDLGSYVNALAKTVLIIRSVEVTFSDSSGRSNSIAGLGQAVAQFQLMTQSQGDIVLPSEKATISTGRVSIVNQKPGPGNSIGGLVSHDKCTLKDLLSVLTQSFWVVRHLLTLLVMCTVLLSWNAR